MGQEKLSQADYRSLAEFRFQIRRFQHFSEHAARSAGINPAQHQLLLALKGIPAGTAPSIRHLAERLFLRHHSTVELVDRLQERGLVRRSPSGTDRRQVSVQVTPLGENVLEKLSLIHRAELRSGGPLLVKALQPLSAAGTSRRRRLSS
jgi:DNA-binding MarR family transcriptional regulator